MLPLDCPRLRQLVLNCETQLPRREYPLLRCGLMDSRSEPRKRLVVTCHWLRLKET
jgi:hypothetical protein